MLRSRRGKVAGLKIFYYKKTIGQIFMILLKDIAKKTGYSVNTVSRALRGDREINIKTKETILEIAKEMGYIRNDVASTMRGGKSKIIAVILSDISNPYFSICIKAIEREVAKANYSLVIFNTNENENDELKAIQTAKSKMVDGVIICPVQSNRNNIEFLEKISMKYVLLGRHFNCEEDDFVISDDLDAGRKAGRMALESGHKSAVYFTAPLYISSASERLAGFREVFCAGSDTKINVITVEMKPHGVYEYILERDEIGDGANLVVCYSDLMANECIRGLKQKKYAIPADISVISFDGIHNYIYSATEISGIKMPIPEISALCFKLLYNKINGKSDYDRHNVFPVQYTEGETLKQN